MDDEDAILATGPRSSEVTPITLWTSATTKRYAPLASFFHGAPLKSSEGMLVD